MGLYSCHYLFAASSWCGQCGYAYQYAISRAQNCQSPEITLLRMNLVEEPWYTNRLKSEETFRDDENVPLAHRDVSRDIAISDQVVQTDAELLLLPIYVANDSS